MGKLYLLICILSFPIGLPAQSLLWKISGNGLESPAYLLGTYHIVEGIFLDSIPGYAEAFSKAEQVIKEIDEKDFAQHAGSVRQIVRMPVDTTLKDLVSKPDYRVVKRKFREVTHIPLFFFKKMKPLLICLYMQVEISKGSINGGRNVIGMDSYIEREARRNNKQIVGVDDMLNVLESYFNNFSLHEQAEALVTFAKHPETGKTDVGLYVYKKFDLEKLQEFVVSSTNPVLYALLVEGRNNYWMQKLAVLIHEKPSLIVVGAGHLPGEKGLLCQFKKLGYTVEPVLK